MSSIRSFFKPLQPITHNFNLPNVDNQLLQTKINDLMKERSRKKKRGTYTRMDETKRAEVATYAQLNGLTKAQQHFKEIDLSLSTISNLKKTLINRIVATKNPIVTELCRKKMGRPLKIGEELDKMVFQHCQLLRLKGSPLNTVIIIGIAQGIISHFQPTLLSSDSEFLTRHWAKSFLLRHNFVKRKGTKAGRSTPIDLNSIKEDFLQRVKSTVEEHLIPRELIFNFDQTGFILYPFFSKLTHSPKSSKNCAS